MHVLFFLIQFRVRVLYFVTARFSRLQSSHKQYLPSLGRLTASYTRVFKLRQYARIALRVLVGYATRAARPPVTQAAALSSIIGQRENTEKHMMSLTEWLQAQVNLNMAACRLDTLALLPSVFSTYLLHHLVPFRVVQIHRLSCEKYQWEATTRCGW